jgi:hypothetical protein
MISKELLKNKYNKLIRSNKEEFIKEADSIIKTLSSANIDVYKPLLVHGSNNRDEFMYAAGVYYSLKKKRIQDYLIVTALHYIEQHFLEANQKDMELYNRMYSTDILVVTVNDTDTRGGTYADALLVNLIETRELDNKITIVYAENVGLEYPVVTKYLTTKQPPLSLSSTKSSITTKRNTNNRRKIF